jgi:Carboxypeptidase regulatory-like domain
VVSKSNRLWFRIVVCALASIICHYALAQSGGKGTIQGTVTDPSGAVIRNSEVTAVHVRTGETTTQKTTGGGFYAMASLNPGVYNLTVKAPGFQTYVQQKVPLDALQVFGLNVTLHVGGSSEIVTISPAPPPLDTANATIGNTMESESYESLPLNMGGVKLFTNNHCMPSSAEP